MRKKSKIWREKRRARNLFLKNRRPKPKRKKVIVEPKKAVSGPRRIVRNLSYDRPFEKLSRSGKKDERLRVLKNFKFDKMFRFLLFDVKSPLNVNNLIVNNYHQKDGTIEIPEKFSVIDNPEKTYFTLQKIVSLLFLESGNRLFLDYGKCHYVELGTQMLLDIIITTYDTFVDKLLHINPALYNLFAKNMSGDNYTNQNVAKIVFSVGTPVTLGIRRDLFDDVEKLEVIKHSGEDDYNDISPREMTEIEITQIEDYVISSLSKMHRELNDDQKDSLGIVIGEILINAQEHSTTDCRFAAGYFAKETINGEDVGLFRLVIMNLGQSIYEKFKDDKCLNKNAVWQMQKLSEQYTQKKIFKPQFTEEELWTLYALQEGVTSVVKKENSRSRRGNGSLRFIENFFKLKGDDSFDGHSSMHIISGRASINFDGSYAIQHKTNEEGEEFAVMSFNNTGSLSDKPDSKYVKDNGIHFPGTLITIQLYLKDLQPLNNAV